MAHMFRLVRNDQNLVLVQRTAVGVLGPPLIVVILMVTIIGTKFPWAMVGGILAFLVAIAFVYKERRVMIDPVGRAIAVKDIAFLQAGEFRTYFFDDLAKPIEFIEESPLMGRFLRATFKDGTVVDLTQPRRRGDLNEAAKIVDELNRTIFGPQLHANPPASLNARSS